MNPVESGGLPSIEGGGGVKLSIEREDLEQQAAEKACVKARRVPEAPTPAEIADHNGIHEP